MTLRRRCVTGFRVLLRACVMDSSLVPSITTTVTCLFAYTSLITERSPRGQTVLPPKLRRRTRPVKERSRSRPTQKYRPASDLLTAMRSRPDRSRMSPVANTLGWWYGSKEVRFIPVSDSESSGATRSPWRWNHVISRTGSGRSHGTEKFCPAPRVESVRRRETAAPATRREGSETCLSVRLTVCLSVRLRSDAVGLL